MMFSSMIFISFIIIFIKHPLSLGFLILMYTTLISLMLGLFSTFWYSYIIFSILIRGLLVLFIYMTSTASNEKFKTNIFLFLSMSMIFSSTMVYKNVNNSFLNEFLIKNMLSKQMKFLNNFYSMKKFLFSPSTKLFVITIVFLLIPLIAAIKICKLNNGPLRQTFYDNTLTKNSSLIKIVNNAWIDLPSPSNISTLWNFGSVMGICLMIQILTAIFLAMHYCPDINNAFNSVSHICRDINYGWLIRTIHAYAASMFFICLYIHVGRGLYYPSFKLLETWTMGILFY